MRFSVFQDSLIGARRVNQDRAGYSYSRDALLLVIADGMGGHVQGEVAAEIAVGVITGLFQQRAKTTVRKPRDFLSEAMRAAHQAVFDYAEQRQMTEYPRTTCVVCLAQNNRAYWAHAGDSRLYLFRRGALCAQTRDHSRVQQLVDAGVITPALAETHPDRNRIFSCLGGPTEPVITYSAETALMHADTLMLSTDGFWSQVPPGEISAELSASTILDAMPVLMQRAEVRAGDQADNLSVIAITWDDREDAAPQSVISTATMPLDLVTTQLNPILQGKQGGFDEDVSDEEIERAIEEIRSSIKKYSRSP